MPLAENTQVEEIAIRNKNSYSNSYKIVVGIYRPDKKESETKLTSLTAKTVKSKIKISALLVISVLIFAHQQQVFQLLH